MSQKPHFPSTAYVRDKRTKVSNSCGLLDNAWKLQALKLAADIDHCIVLSGQVAFLVFTKNVPHHRSPIAK